MGGSSVRLTVRTPLFHGGDTGSIPVPSTKNTQTKTKVMIETNTELTTKVGLKCVTTKKQERNGTAVYHDPLTNMYYGVYSSGYVRRLPSPDCKNRFLVIHYPLNKRCRENRDNTYVLIHSHEDRVKRMLEVVDNHRMSHKMTFLRRKFPELSTKDLRELAKKNYAHFSKDW